MTRPMLHSTRKIPLFLRAVVAAGALAATGVLAAGPAAADAHHHRHAWRGHHHHARLVRGPVGTYVPGERYDNLGVDDDPSTDGIGVGRNEPVPGPENFPGVAATSSYPAPGYEIEGPPISPSLPNVPVLTPELLN